MYRSRNLDEIDKGASFVETEKAPDALDVIEMSNTQLVAAKLANRLTYAKLEDLEADRAMRQKYANRILWYLKVYSVCVYILILLSGWDCFKFTLQKEVLITLVGSTALAAIGLVGFIARGLFNTSIKA